MSFVKNIASGVRALFRKHQAEQEMDDELRGYLDAAIKDKIRSGMSQEEALRAARCGSLFLVALFAHRLAASRCIGTVSVVHQPVENAIRQSRPAGRDARATGPPAVGWSKSSLGSGSGSHRFPGSLGARHRRA